MKRICTVTAIATILSSAAWAQDVRDMAKLRAEKMAQVVGDFKFGLIGPTVKGAPYTAEGSSETQQTLGDGTHIRRQESYTIYRDGEGRIRRENGNQVWISDPVAGVSFVLDTRNQTARKMTLSQGISTAKIVADAQTAKLNKEAAFKKVYFTGGPLGNAKDATSESLGKQEMEGVEVAGTRTTISIAQGEIGNDRPLQIVNERWESPELHVTVLLKRTDPMAGDTTERLTNIRRGEPDPSLFQVPAGYTLRTPSE